MARLGSDLDKAVDWPVKGSSVIAEITTPCCKTCKFWERIEDKHERKFGRCLRNPPQFVMSDALNGEWPVIKADQWCGEHAEHTDVQRH